MRQFIPRFSNLIKITAITAIEFFRGRLKNIFRVSETFGEKVMNSKTSRSQNP